MNSRERFLETVRFGCPDRIFFTEFFSFRKPTLDRWHKEGLPVDVYPSAYFGFDRHARLSINLGPVPPFENVILMEDEHYKVWINNYGIKLRTFKHADMGFQSREFLEFPVKTRKEWLEMKERYNPKSPVRYPEWWEDLVDCLRHRSYPLRIDMPGLFWWIRDLMGLQRTCISFIRDPDFVNEMMDFYVEFLLKALHKALDAIRLDFALIAEDMAYKTGPMISPRMVREFMLPRYKRIVRFLKDHGIDIIFVDCDGNVDLLIPIWLEAGINGFLPCEVAAGMDPVALRKKFGKKLIIWGGIDKRALSKGRKSIEREVTSKVPYMALEGGYIPSIDHIVPEDVSFNSYLYYIKMLRKVISQISSTR